ncbi:MAG: hypothetical protein HY608_10875, partial [Planctomycetes bacterium]|nr:hypothetical protein [Planctomycetota bacterium]
MRAREGAAWRRGAWRRGAAACAVLAWLAVFGGAADEDVPEVVDVRIEGLQHLSEAYVRSRIEIRPGEPLHRARLQEDIRRLHAEGAVRSVRVEEVAAPGG